MMENEKIGKTESEEGIGDSLPEEKVNADLSKENKSDGQTGESGDDDGKVKFLWVTPETDLQKKTASSGIGGKLKKFRTEKEPEEKMATPISVPEEKMAVPISIPDMEQKPKAAKPDAKLKSKHEPAAKAAPKPAKPKTGQKESEAKADNDPIRSWLGKITEKSVSKPSDVMSAQNPPKSGQLSSSAARTEAGASGPEKEKNPVKLWFEKMTEQRHAKPEAEMKSKSSGSGQKPKSVGSKPEAEQSVSKADQKTKSKPGPPKAKSKSAEAETGAASVGSKAKPKQDRPKSEAKPADGKTEAKPTETKPKSEAKPADGKTEAKPTETKPKKKKEKKPRRKLKVRTVIILILLVLFVTAALAAGGYAIYLIRTTEDIRPEKIYSRIEMSSFLYDSKGNEIDRIYYTEDRQTVSIDKIPDVTKNAFIAIEDKTFYKHHGFNFTRMIGAIINKLIGRSEEISGTSTITQQLARNVFLAEVKSQRSLDRKFREMIYAWKIERALTKDQILEAYLNTIYLGYGNYGIDAAARTYFDKDVGDLNLAESAALAALPQAPDSYALLRDEKDEGLIYLRKYDVYANDASRERRELVLDLMVDQGYVSKEEADSARVGIKKLLKPDFGEERSGEYTYFTDYAVSEVVRDIAAKYDMSEEEAQRFVYTGGLRIRTTVDPAVQSVINKEFAEDDNFPWSAEEPQAAMVVTQVGTGKIVGMVGGRGASGKKLFNRATSPRQPGSSIKPLSVYSAALQKSFDCEAAGRTFPFIDYGYDRQGIRYWGDYITASSTVIDERMLVNGEVWPQNFSKRYSGRQTFRSALQQSLNTCAVKIQLQVGVDYSMDLLKKYGITTAVDDSSQKVNDLNSAALALGAMTYGVTPLDMSNAYAVFPNGGVRNTPVSYTEVTDPNGNVILKGKSEKVKVLDEGVAYIMTDCLKSNVYRGIARSASLYGVQSGGKTGTTNDTADIWFCGFVPSYSAALWIGTDKNSEMNTTSNTAAALWSRIMGQIPDVTDGYYREMPDDVLVQYGEYYTKGTEPGYRYHVYSAPSYDSGDDDDASDDSEDEKSGSDKDSDKGESDEWVRDWMEEN